MADKQYLFHNAKLRKLSEKAIFSSERHNFHLPIILSSQKFASYDYNGYLCKRFARRRHLPTITTFFLHFSIELTHGKYIMTKKSKQ